LGFQTFFQIPIDFRPSGQKVSVPEMSNQMDCITLIASEGYVVPIQETADTTRDEGTAIRGIKDFTNLELTLSAGKK
jgi:hypothetical protein